MSRRQARARGRGAGFIKRAVGRSLVNGWSHCSAATSAGSTEQWSGDSVWPGWVLGQNTVDPHRPTHSHTLYAYKAYCAPTHICTVYIQTGPIYMLLAHSMNHSTCTLHEQRTCTQRAQRALRHAPRRMYAIACLTSAYIRRRRKLIYLLVSSRADKERRALPRHHNTTNTTGANDGGCVKQQQPT